MQRLCFDPPPGGAKTSEDVSASALNGAGAGGSFCIPAGMVIPSLVALPPEASSSAPAGPGPSLKHASSITNSSAGGRRFSF